MPAGLSTLQQTIFNFALTWLKFFKFCTILNYATFVSGVYSVFILAYLSYIVK